MPTETLSWSLPSITITLTQPNPSCNSCDNWDIEGVKVTVFNSKGPTPARQTLLNLGNLAGGSGDDCVARLKASPNATAATFTMDGTNGHSYANGVEQGAQTGCKNNGDNQ
jgi:hypothetical protein